MRVRARVMAIDGEEVKGWDSWEGFICLVCVHESSWSDQSKIDSLLQFIQKQKQLKIESQRFTLILTNSC